MEQYGLGAVAIALAGLVWKIWHDSRQQSDKFFKSQEDHADKLLTITRENIETRLKDTQSRDKLTEAIAKIIKIKR